MRLIIAICFLSLVFADPANAQGRPTQAPAQTLPSSGNTLAGPGGFDLLPDESVFVFESFKTIPICITLVVTAPDVTLRLNVENFTTVFVTDAATRSLCVDNTTVVELRCDLNSPANCTGFWRVDSVQ